MQPEINGNQCAKMRTPTLAPAVHLQTFLPASFSRRSLKEARLSVLWQDGPLAMLSCACSSHHKDLSPQRLSVPNEIRQLHLDVLPEC